MTVEYLHLHKNFQDLIRIVAEHESIDPSIIEKDYWIMHCLYALGKNGYSYYLKGGTSLSKGYGIIHRFSEDIDILIDPPAEMNIKTGRNHDKPHHIEGRKQYYDWLANKLKDIPGIIDVQRDHEFDDKAKYRSAGIRLHYQTDITYPKGIKEGILLEVGFDDIEPYEKQNISSLMYDFAHEKAMIIDNRAFEVPCYHPGYTLVEKLQAVSTKYRDYVQSKNKPKNFLRHYYDIYCLLDYSKVQDFIGSDDYHEHKKKRFRKADNINISENEGFILSDMTARKELERLYHATSSLYYKGQPSFDNIIEKIYKHIDQL